ncbi:hypothetical protein [Glacieibacterium frigidum]|uniref:Uncharacterized protein n=1 Tax=Glacieibacterium frigidum TaxID=2593303 RepID=A0A552UF74_9SPHN|nr:hypothetical protein [Glacieibacterium frigidum]TRW16876.1 hypothetical protein FMM06_01315 [Glacieibacterium frigidum]
MILIALLLLAADADGFRDAGVEARSPETLVSLQACITRQMGRGGQVTPVPLPDGVALDMSMGRRGKGIISVAVHDEGVERRLTMGYRHPWSAKIAAGLFNDLARSCFPASPPVPR